MMYQESIQVKKEYIILKGGGSFSETKDMPEMMRSLIEIAKSKNMNKIVVDLSQVKGFISASSKFELGELAAKIWGYNYKVALIYKSGVNTGMFENVAVNRGGNVRVVNDITEAEKWLLEKKIQQKT